MLPTRGDASFGFDATRGIWHFRGTDFRFGAVAVQPIARGECPGNACPGGRLEGLTAFREHGFPSDVEERFPQRSLAVALRIGDNTLTVTQQFTFGTVKEGMGCPRPEKLRKIHNENC